MDNPSLILQAVDRRLDHAVRLVIYGRAAVCLGFENSPPEAAMTQDVDAIISLSQSLELEQDSGFWAAVEGANAELAAKGLYITHLSPPCVARPCRSGDSSQLELATALPPCDP
jgi:hypothetical protein